MSYTTIKGIWPGDRTEDLMELRNSHGSAPPVWEAMATRYLGVSKSYDHPNPGWMQLEESLWDLWKRDDIPVGQRAVFMLTFDRAYVTKENYRHMADDIRAFLIAFPPKPETVNHWRKIAEFMDSNPDVPALGLRCTSVSEDPFQGPWNEEAERYDPPDWTQSYDLYALLAGVAT